MGSTSPDGTRLYVSRANLGDVAAFDLIVAGFPMIWRTEVSGRKADHAAISPDGERIVVSAQFGAGKAEVLETEFGRKVGDFRTGLLPHQNDYSADGRRIYNSSLGPLSFELRDLRLLQIGRGARRLTVVDAETLEVIRTYKFDAGIRPSVIANDGKTFYTQLSYLNGLVAFDLESGEIVDRSDQPLSDYALAEAVNDIETPRAK